MQEIRAYLGYTDSGEELTYWHTYANDEVDAVIGDARVAIEIKSTDHVGTEHKKGLKKFAEEHPEAKQVIVSRDFITRHSGDIDIDKKLLDAALPGIRIHGCAGDINMIYFEKSS